MTAIPPPPRQPRRRGLKWLAIAAAALLLPLAVAAVLLPRLADPERHRATLEAALTQATGWRTQLGTLDVSLWNGLAVRAQPVTLSAPSGGSSVEIEEVDVFAALWPLLSGRLAVEKVVLLRPHFVLERQTDGRWELPLYSSRNRQPDAPAGDASSAGVAPSRGTVEARPAEGGSTAIRATPPDAISVGELELRGGTLRLVDRSAAPGGALALQELNALVTPATGRLWGQARFAAGPGKLSWQGTIVDGVQIDVEQATAQLLSDWFGRNTIRPAGSFSARVRTLGWTHANIEAEGEGLQILAGGAALPKLSVRAAVVREESLGDWSLDGTVDLGGLRFRGGGRFAPSLQMLWRAQHEPVDVAIGVLAALGPLPMTVAPPGLVDAEVRLSRRIDGPLQIAARADFNAKSLTLDPSLPALEAVRASLVLDQDRVLIEPLEGRLCGGMVRLSAQLLPAAPEGTLTVTGTLRGASLESLMRATGAKQTFPGKTDLDLDITWPLARGRTVDTLSGTAVLMATDVVLPAWKALGDDATRFDRVDATVRMLTLPWTLEGVRASGPTLTVDGGRGTLHPRRGTLELPLDVTLAAEPSMRLTQRVSALKHLQGESGELHVSGKVSGLLATPQLTLDLEKSLLKSGQTPKDLARGLLDDYLKRKQDKKKKKKPSEPATGGGG